MGATAAIHPNDDTLRSHALGELDRASAESVNQHLEGCSACQRRASEISPDGALGPPNVAHGKPSSTGPCVSSLDGLSILDDGENVEPPPQGTLPPGLVDHPDYEVIRELGQGGMGTVYLAKNRLLFRLEVLKVVSKDRINRPGALDRFLIEIRNAASLHHTNVVTAYSAMRIGESIIFAMEFVDGLDLSKLVKAKGPLPVANACNYVHQTALGLQHASELGMVHRDIKPGNLMLTRQGSRAVIKVLDFGLAKVKSEGAADGGLTYEGQMLGTPEFVSPEQISDARRADIRADIYSLGCTLYYLLTAAPPFHASSLYEILQAHHSMDAFPLNLARPEVPVELAALVARMMAKEPARRFQTPKDVAQALLPFFKKGMVEIARPTPEMSHSGVADQERASTPAVLLPARPVPPLPSVVPAPEAAPTAPRAEPAWEGLIKFREAETLAGPTQSAIGPRRAPRWLWRSAAVGLLLLGLIVAWAVIIRVKTSNGFIELVNLPQDSEVFIDGEEAAVTLPGGGKPAVISVTAGRHKVSVKKDGLKFSGAEVTVQADEKQEFIVRFVPLAASSEVKDRAKDGPTGSEEKGKVVAEGRPAPPLEVTDKRDALGSAVEPPATAPVVKQGLLPAAPPLKPAGKTFSPNTRLVRVDEFNGPQRGLLKDLKVPHDPPNGRSDGVYFVYSTGGWHAWNVHGIRSDGTCEVVGRVLSDHPKKKSAWSVLVLTGKRTGFRGFLVQINQSGELFLEPNPWPKGEAFRKVDPRLGPIVHRAINPGNEFNKLLLVLKKREVVIFVNDVQVCAPVRFGYDITPSTLEFGASGPGKKRAEFDRLEIREFIPPNDATAKAEAAAPAKLAPVEAAGPENPKPMVADNPRKLTTNSVGMTFTLIRAGEFMMGSPEDDTDAAVREKPRHKVSISPFYLGVTEVTQAQYKAVMSNNPSHFSSTGDGKDKVAGRPTEQHPVERVSWFDAVRFCDTLSEKEGRTPFYREKDQNQDRTNKGPGYRLPTEAEWEYACRAETSTKYCFGDAPAQLSEYAWFHKNAGGMTHPVGEKRPNGFGLYDMHGNVTELCSDWLDDAYYQNAPARDPQGPFAGKLRVTRGGQWRERPPHLRSASRGRATPGLQADGRGFRVAVGMPDH